MYVRFLGRGEQFSVIVATLLQSCHRKKSELLALKQQGTRRDIGCEICVGQERDIQIAFAASPEASQEASGAAAASQPLAAGQFQLSEQRQSMPQAAHPHPLTTPLAHHWSWCRTATSHEASAGASAFETSPIMTKASSRQPGAAQSGQGGSSEIVPHWCIQLPVHASIHPSALSQPLACLLFSIRS